MKSRIILPTLFFVCLCVVICHAEEWRSEEFNCGITLPTGTEWVHPKPPNPTIKVFAQTVDRATSIYLLVMPVPDAKMKIDDAFITGYDKAHFPPDKAKKTFGAQLVMNGVPAYKTAGELYVRGTTVHTAGIIWIADGKIYQIGAMEPKTSPFDDQVIKESMASFHFLKPPHDF